jgi:hypothetical protein
VKTPVTCELWQLICWWCLEQNQANVCAKTSEYFLFASYIDKLTITIFIHVVVAVGCLKVGFVQSFFLRESYPYLEFFTSTLLENRDFLNLLRPEATAERAKNKKSFTRLKQKAKAPYCHDE